jgi:hypothetical protein
VGVLRRLEQRLEGAVTGAFARAFRSAVQPVEIAAALQREVDNSAQILSRDRRLAPNDFTVALSASDYERLVPYGETLAAELTGLLRQHADERHYAFAGPLAITLTRNDELTTGRFAVTSAALARVTAAAGAPPSPAVLRKAPLVLEVNGNLHPLNPPGIVVGRGTDADLRIDDPGVSRRHLQIRVSPSSSADDDATVTVFDLGSTNGTIVDGHRVQQATLSEGASIKVGSTTMSIRRPAETG